MTPIRVAIYHRGQRHRWLRIDGQYSYAHPALDWTQQKLPGEPVNLNKLHTDADVAWLDEGKHKERVLFTPPPGKDRQIPVVYYSLYPTLSDDIYESRVARAKQSADLVLCEHDDLERWERDTGLPCRRLAYAVNERYYRDRGQRRDIDVGFYCVYAYNSERPALDEWLEAYCTKRGYSYRSTKGESVGVQYAELLARTKVVVHLNRTRRTRPPRIFDTAASGSALLTNPLPAVSGELFEPWVHYVPFDSPRSLAYQPWTSYKPFSDSECEDVARGLEWLLDDGHWAHVAERAKAYVLACHTWSVRAWQLRGILLDVFPGLREKVGEGWMYQS